MRKTAEFRKTNKLRKTQRGGGGKIPLLEDGIYAAYAILSKPKSDKDKKRLSIYQKRRNLKELLSDIYAINNQYDKAFMKSSTPFLTQWIKRTFANKYDDDWFDKNLVSVDQIKDYINDKEKMCQDLSIYLKQLYIIITWDTTKFERKGRAGNIKLFNCDESLPHIEFTSVDHKKILETIFKKDVLDKFIENYYVVKDEFEKKYVTDQRAEDGASPTEVGASTTEVGASATEVGASTTELKELFYKQDEAEAELKKLIDLKESDNPIIQSNLEKQIKEKREEISNIGRDAGLLALKQFREEKREEKEREEMEREEMEKPAGGRRRNQTKKRNKRNKSNKK